MRNSKKLLIALAVICAVGATPLAAQVGPWMGRGTGFCYPQPGVLIYPWQSWDGYFPATWNYFNGSWVDQLGNQGTFEGAISVSTGGDIVAVGTWTWLNPATGIEEYGGDFEINFYGNDEDPPKWKCEGTWTTIWLTPPNMLGTIEGWQ